MTGSQWFDRTFELGLPADALPNILARLESAPLRLAERVSGVIEDDLVRRVDNRWSIQEQVGHLADLEPLWLGRFDDFAAGGDTLRAADLENRATWDAGHNQEALGDLVVRFRSLRGKLVDRVRAMSDEELRVTAAHPRLNQPMTVADLAFFIAEHDDHHLDAIADAVAALSEAKGR